MRRLIEKGLMFGELVAVDTPALVARYNRALQKLTGQQTALPDFHIDISGFSPEIADELGDPLYLNPNGVNQQFILLSTAQAGAPLLNPKFSYTRPLLREFIRTNESELFALTTRDAVAGEMTNSVLEIGSAAQLFDIRKLRIEADTTSAHVAEARKLAEKITRFRTEPESSRRCLFCSARRCAISFRSSVTCVRMTSSCARTSGGRLFQNSAEVTTR